MKAPFVWFGGKRRVADVVWRALGDVDNRHKEVLWMSPHCVAPPAQPGLFDAIS